MKKPSPTMRKCKSSQVIEHGHCPATNTLRVVFKSGGTYDYHGVDAEKYAALLKAESIGKHLGQSIKPHHKFTKRA